MVVPTGAQRVGIATVIREKLSRSSPHPMRWCLPRRLCSSVYGRAPVLVVDHVLSHIENNASLGVPTGCTTAGKCAQLRRCQIVPTLEPGQQREFTPAFLSARLPPYPHLRQRSVHFDFPLAASRFRSSARTSWKSSRPDKGAKSVCNQFSNCFGSGQKPTRTALDNQTTA